LRLAGLPEERAVVPWPAEIARSTVVRRRHVLLHGDFAPENLVFSADQVYCLDADLLDRGPEDLDVVRFLTMLYDAPFFITGSGVRVVSRLRVRTGAAFLRAYYGDVVPVVTWWALIEGIASRWAMRHADCVARQPAFTSTRLALLDRHFSSILDELAVAARQSGGVVSEPELG